MMTGWVRRDWGGGGEVDGWLYSDEEISDELKTVPTYRRGHTGRTTLTVLRKQQHYPVQIIRISGYSHF